MKNNIEARLERIESKLDLMASDPVKLPKCRYTGKLMKEKIAELTELGYSRSQIAEQLSVSVGTVARARREIKAAAIMQVSENLDYDDFIDF